MSAKTSKAVRHGSQTAWQIFRWPLLIALANAVGLAAALIGDGWYDLISWVTLGLTLVLIAAKWRGRSAG